ncbi:MAG TPA: hypothetical protein VIY47_12770 [Ignavibacteriaceae bacterium]
MNACIGIAEVLRDRGHRIVFATSSIWREKLKIYNFEEEIIEIKDMKTNEDPAKHWAEVVERSGVMGSLPTIQKMKVLCSNIFKEEINRIKNTDTSMRKIINRVKPDIIVIDGFVWMPSVMNSDIPWVWSFSTNPLCMDYGIDDERLPPSFSGQKFQNSKNI